MVYYTGENAEDTGDDPGENRTSAGLVCGHRCNRKESLL